jgi:hypothetical protein
MVKSVEEAVAAEVAVEVVVVVATVKPEVDVAVKPEADVEAVAVVTDPKARDAREDPESKVKRDPRAKDAREDLDAIMMVKPKEIDPKENATTPVVADLELDVAREPRDTEIMRSPESTTTETELTVPDVETVKPVATNTEREATESLVLRKERRLPLPSKVRRLPLPSKVKSPSLRRPRLKSLSPKNHPKRKVSPTRSTSELSRPLPSSLLLIRSSRLPLRQTTFPSLAVSDRSMPNSPRTMATL